jgi:hypothetical protein
MAQSEMSICLALRSVFVSFLLVGILSGANSVKAMSGSGVALQDQGPFEKESRTPAQRKIDSQLLYEIYRRRGEAAQKNVPPGKTRVKIDEIGRALVDVRGEVTPGLEKQLIGLGGTIVSTSVEYRSIVAWVPLLKLYQLAENEAVRAIEPPAEATTNRQPAK